MEFLELYSENVIAKLWRKPPESYPHTVPQTGPSAGTYEYREADFWTCGFFPGSLYALLERLVKYPKSFPLPSHLRANFHQQLLKQCRYWDGPIRGMAGRTDTHDMGFIIQPALRTDWELNGNRESLGKVVEAAHALASRYNERVKAIRSWDSAINYRYSFTDMKTNFLVIIDSMCNLDLLCYAGYHTGDQNLIDIATTHAHTILTHVVRPDNSTYHLVNFSPSTGLPLLKLTNQGYADSSTWSRGQAWAILGFTQIYSWTKDPVFLNAAVGLAKYFLGRLDEVEGQHEYPYVPLWDFDAPVKEEEGGPLRDTSAGMIAVNGLLILHQIHGTSPVLDTAPLFFLDAALRILKETVALSLSKSKAAFKNDSQPGKIEVVDVNGSEETFAAILRNATANWNPDAHKPYKDHGLVYGDYYFLEAGNKLLRMGLI
ncbi:glucuronyl hydrolase-like protein [Bisporella sp. PMI_857]|nr:glucuronyl hydrolase-like protein [Bisporella sp. PMI_857]